MKQPDPEPGAAALAVLALVVLTVLWLVFCTVAAYL